MSIIKFEIDLEDLWADDESLAAVLREEIKHEFRLAVRRAIKSDAGFERQATKVAIQLRQQLEETAERILA